jgi:hypothetical protein
MSETSAKEELRVINLAHGTLDGLIPVGLDRDAVEYDHECAKYEPGNADDEHNLDRDSDG